ncbi:hypothetical protein [Vibrio profundi]|uniref:hypothetical protein n=1 Tax=Vibrio profundi TaxID=1774960 RepID=UPI00373687CF
MKTNALLLSVAVSGYAFADTATFDFETAVEEFSEITIESTAIDFTDPTAAFSSIQLGYNNAGFDTGIGYAKGLNDRWAGLVFAQTLTSFDAYRVRAAALSTSFGTGVMGDYMYDSENDGHTMLLNALQILPIHESVLIAPVLGVGAMSSEELESHVPLAMIQLYNVLKVTHNLSLMVTPVYTQSLSDKHIKISTLDWETNLSYRLNGNQNISINYSVYEQADSSFGIHYTYAL